MSPFAPRFRTLESDANQSVSKDQVTAEIHLTEQIRARKNASFRFLICSNVHPATSNSKYVCCYRLLKDLDRYYAYYHARICSRSWSDATRYVS